MIGACQAILVLVSALPGQTAPAPPAPAGAAESRPAPAAMPQPGDLLVVLDKATTQPAAGTQGGGDWSAPVKLAVVFALLALLPSLLVMMTSFTRIMVVLAFLRRALTTQNIPPNIAMIGLALFLTLFTMAPTFATINEQALQPYLKGGVAFPDACQKGYDALKDFMMRQVRPSDVGLFAEMAGVEATADGKIPGHVLIPSFAISEFRKAFEMGCLIFIPFLLIDLVISSILLSAGMMMLPPAMISLPFKIILFVLVDGWALTARTLVSSFN